jgi:hypothetical protein
MMKLVRMMVCLAASCLVSDAAPLIFAGSLNGPNEDPPVPSMGVGSAMVTYDPMAHTLAVDVNWSGLTEGTTVAHIHCCVSPSATPSTVGVATYPGTFPMSPEFPLGFPVGVTFGEYRGSWSLTETSSYTMGFLNNFGGGTAAGAEAALISGLLAGEAYLNIHTTFSPGGEIRDFLTLIPEPGTYALFGSALAALAIVRLRKKSA